METGAESLGLPSTFKFNQIVKYFFITKMPVVIVFLLKCFTHLKNIKAWARKK